MVEEKKVEEPKTDAQPEPTRAADDTVTIRKGELAGYKTQLKQMQKQLEEFTTQKSAEEAAKLKAASDWEALEKKSRAELETLKADLEKTKRAALSEKARAALLEAGMRAGLTANGAISLLPQDIESEGIAAWVNDIRTQYPDEFKAPTNPIGAPAAGATGRPTTDEATSIKTEFAEALKKSPSAAAAAKRRVDDYIRRTGKNPLA